VFSLQALVVRGQDKQALLWAIFAGGANDWAGGKEVAHA